jgi:hypothetical protein
LIVNRIHEEFYQGIVLKKKKKKVLFWYQVEKSIWDRVSEYNKRLN